MTVVLFDMDGTLTDPGYGITGSYQEVFRERGLSPPERSDLHWTIGPPIRHALKTLFIEPGHATSDELEHLVLRYRHYYVGQKLMLNDKPYAGIGELLERLRRELPETRFYVATGKAHAYAREILEHFDLLKHFVGVYGPELDGTRSDKKILLDWLFQQEKVSPSDCVMVGDRHHDVNAAKAHKVKTIGVLWGYGSAAELNEAGACCLVRSPDDLAGTLIAAASERWQTL